MDTSFGGEDEKNLEKSGLDYKYHTSIGKISRS